MSAPYSVDLRWRIVRTCEQGAISQRQVAELFQVSLATVENLLRLYRRTGDVTPQRQRPPGRPPRFDATVQAQIRHWLADQSDLTLAELQDRLAQQATLEVSVSALCRLLKKMGLRRKKRRSMPANGTARAYVWRAVATADRWSTTQPKG